MINNNDIYSIVKEETKFYRGFKFSIRDYKNRIINRVVREVKVEYTMSVRADIASIFNRRVIDRPSLNSFQNLADAKSIIDYCYKLANSLPNTEGVSWGQGK